MLPDIVLAAGMPRSGTSLTANIMRELLERSGRHVMMINPIGDLEASLRRATSAPDVAIVHCHIWGPTCDEALIGHRVSGVVSVRDPRDAAVSWAVMMQLSVPLAAEHLATYATAQHPTFFRGLDLLPVRYEAHMSDRPGHVSRIAAHLGLSPTDEQIAEVVGATSVDVHRGHMEAAAAGRGDDVETRTGAHAVLAEHMPTMITGRHIQSGAVGRWRTELSPAVRGWVRARLRAACADLGYDPD